MCEREGSTGLTLPFIFYLLSTFGVYKIPCWELGGQKGMQVLCFWGFPLAHMDGVEKWGWASRGSLHAKDGVQSVGLVRVPIAKLCLPHFQDHIRVTLGVRHSEERTGNGESTQAGQAETSQLHQMELVGRWQSRWQQSEGAPGHRVQGRVWEVPGRGGAPEDAHCSFGAAPYQAIVVLGL